MSNPYFYKIKHKTTGKYYVGSQYGKTSNKSNFFTSYTTSSKKINKIIKDEGIGAFDIVILKERSDAREYEHRYLKKAYSLLGKEKFLSMFYNRNISPGIILDNDIIAQQTFTKKQSWATGKKLKPMPPNWKGKTRSQTMKDRLSASKLGHTVSLSTRQKLSNANIGKTQTEITKKKRADALKKNKNAYGRKYWLFVSPTNQYYFTIGKRNHRLHSLGLSEGSGFINYVNTNKSPSQGKNIGWLFFEGEERIKEVLKNVNEKDIIYYE